MQRKNTTVLTKSCIMGFDFQVERMEKVKKFSLFFSLTCLFKHKLGRAQQKSATRHVTFPSIVVSDVRMRAARCRSTNCLWTRTCSGWVTDQTLFVFVIFAVHHVVLCSWMCELHHKLLEGQTKFTCNGYRPSFFFFGAFWNFIPKQNIQNSFVSRLFAAQSKAPCVLFLNSGRFLWLDLIHFETARNHSPIGQLSFKGKRPARPVRTVLDHKRPLDGCLCQPAKD